MFSTSAFRLWSLAFLAPGEEKPPPLVRRPVFVSGAASNPGNVVRSRQSTKRAQGVAGAGYMREGGRELWKWPAASITFSGKRWKSSAALAGTSRRHHGTTGLRQLCSVVCGRVILWSPLGKIGAMTPSSRQHPEAIATFGGARARRLHQVGLAAPKN